MLQIERLIARCERWDGFFPHHQTSLCIWFIWLAFCLVGFFVFVVWGGFFVVVFGEFGGIFIGFFLFVCVFFYVLVV